MDAFNPTPAADDLALLQSQGFLGLSPQVMPQKFGNPMALSNWQTVMLAAAKNHPQAGLENPNDQPK